MKPPHLQAVGCVLEGKVNVFDWVEGPFGYAISADADRAALARVSGEVSGRCHCLRACLRNCRRDVEAAIR